MTKTSKINGFMHNSFGMALKTKLPSLFIVLTLFAGIHRALTQPTLTIAPAGNQVVLSWPATAINYVLQSTTDLVSPSWGPVTDAVLVTINNIINVTVTNTSSTMFFRLYNTNMPIVSTGMAIIPAGGFRMGDNLDGMGDATPTNVTVSAFYMDVNLVSYGQW